MTKRVYIANPSNRDYLCSEIRKLENGYQVRTGPASRSLAQNAKLHAMFGEVAQQAKYMGRTLTALQWKNLLLSAHSIATGVGVDVVPGLEGEWVNIRESSANMTIARMNSLIEYINAWAAENGVTFTE